MTDTGVLRYTPYALVATAVFEFMHIADELAGNWAPFRPFNDPMIATMGMGVFTLLAMWSLWWSLEERPWGYGIAVLFGLFFLLAEMWHVFDSSNMTAFRWVVVLLAQLSALVVVVLGAHGLRIHRPWS